MTSSSSSPPITNHLPTPPVPTLIAGINTDDGIILASSRALLDEFREYYDGAYTVRWGDITKYGGVNVVDDGHGSISVHQNDFIAKAWDKWRDHASASRSGGARGGGPPTLPATPDLESLTSPQALAANTPSKELTTLYKSCVGDIGWYTRTRPELMAAYNSLAKGLDKSNEELLQRAIQCHAFAASTPDMHPRFTRSTLPDPVAYSDANLGIDRSTTGYCVYLANAPVLTVCRTQKCTVLSSCEAELVALSAATCDVIWVRNVLTELGYPPSGPTPVFVDNTAAKQVAENPVSARHLRHVARRHFFVQDAVTAGLVTVPYVKSELNLADALTKLLPNAPKFRWAAARLHSWTMAL